MLSVVAGWCVPASIGGMVLCHRQSGHMAIEPAHHSCLHGQAEEHAREQAGMNAYGTCHHPHDCDDIPLETAAKAPERSVRTAQTKAKYSAPPVDALYVPSGRCVNRAVGFSRRNRPPDAFCLQQIRTVILLL